MIFFKKKYILYNGIYIIMHIQASFLPLSKLDAHLSMHLGMLEVADNEVYHLWMEGVGNAHQKHVYKRIQVSNKTSTNI
jgi:hypothetical protein